jgi:ubiquinone/menaquinone biosynthesis C-methylase UbiE
MTVVGSAPVKRERDEVFVEFTKSICPVCKVGVDAQVNIRAGKVYLRKRCREHGWFEALVYGDAQMYLDSARFNKPGTILLTWQTEVREGCPADCGLCPQHKQHACLGIIEVNTGCNLDCPICFADFGHHSDGYEISKAQCEAMLDVVKACCAASYGSDLVGLLLGEAYHPGGLALTRHLADRLALTRGSRVLDVASGRGTTAVLLASEYGVRVDGIDLAAANVALAQAAADAAGLTQVSFIVGDAETLPYPDGVFDAVICECALCTFPDKRAAAGELARVLRPGGRVGITDVVADPARLPAELTGLAAWVACIGDARTLDEYAVLLTRAGLRVTDTARHDGALARMIDQIAARLALVRMTNARRADAIGIDFNRVPAVLGAARAALDDQVLGYALLVAEKPP